MTATFPIFSELLAPVGVATFFSDYYGQKPAHMVGKAGRFADLFGWRSLNGLLNATPFPHPKMRVHREGKSITVRSRTDILDRLRAGATLVIENADEYDLRLGAYLDALSHEITIPTRFVMYLSFPGIQGYDVHYDTHDFLILQIAGSKQWHVHEKTIESPLYHQKTHGLDPPASDPILSPLLNEGDVLYCPKGFWHYAKSVAEPSLHLTLALPARTRMDFLTWLVDELRDDPFFRKEFPFVAWSELPSSARDASPYQPSFDELRTGLSRVLKDDTLLHRFHHFTQAFKPVRHRFTLPYNFMPAAECAAASTSFSTVHRPFVLKTGDDKATLTFAGRTYDFPFRALGLLQFISAQTKAFERAALAEVSNELTAPQIDLILGTLVREGLVVPVG